MAVGSDAEGSGLVTVGSDADGNGVAALKNHPDPFGQGPFEYKALPQGFELKSKFVMDGQPATLTVGK